MELVGYEIQLKRGDRMRPLNRRVMERMMEYINLHFREEYTRPTIKEISKGTGIPHSTVQRYLKILSEDGFFDYDRGIVSPPESSKIKSGYSCAPIVGSIACGNPTQEEENIEEYVSLPESIFGQGSYYILTARGDSMEDAFITEGDFLVIEKKSSASVGDIVVALDPDGQNTLKRYGGYDRERKCHLLYYENEAVYPGKVIEVSSLTVQGVLRNIIKRSTRRYH